jgi:hypothetical protein
MNDERWRKYGDSAVLARVTVRLIHSNEERRWKKLMEERHYLKSSCLVGRQLRYVAVLDGRWVALLGWSDASYHLRWREDWIGWTPAQKQQRLKFVVQNSRYLLLVERGEYPNLASRILALCGDRLLGDWEIHYGYRPLVAETFVDPELFRGSCYRAAGWEVLGPTQGYSRHHRDFYQEDGRPKELWIKKLHPKARKWLSDARMPPALAGEEDPIRYCHYTRQQYRSLWERFNQLTDKRASKGRQHRMASTLTIAALATLCGCRGTRAIADFASHLTQTQLRLLRAYYDEEAERYVAPSEPTLRRMLESVSSTEFDLAIIAWSESIDPTSLTRLAVDGKTVKKARQKDGRQLHLVAAVSHESTRLVAQRPVDEKSNEITALEPMLRPVVLDGVIVTADAMQTQHAAARFLTQEKGALYFLSLKGNQPSIEAKAEALLSSAFPPSASATSVHG